MFLSVSKNFVKYDHRLPAMTSTNCRKFFFHSAYCSVLFISHSLTKLLKIKYNISSGSTKMIIILIIIVMN